MADTEAQRSQIEADLNVDNDLVELSNGAGQVPVLTVAQVLTVVAAPFAIGFFICFEAIN